MSRNCPFCDQDCSEDVVCPACGARYQPEVRGIALAFAYCAIGTLPGVLGIEVGVHLASRLPGLAPYAATPLAYLIGLSILLCGVRWIEKPARQALKENRWYWVKDEERRPGQATTANQ